MTDSMRSAFEAAGFWTLPPKSRPWCDGKFPHASMAAAEAAIRSLRRRELAQEDKGEIRAYQCVTCLRFHTGHRRNREEMPGL